MVKLRFDVNDKKDSLYSEAMDSIPEFIFDQKVVAVFDDMIQRSVPGYRMLVSMVALLAQRYCQDNSQIYDLGCSTGVNVVALASALHNSEINGNIIAVDNSSPMLTQAQSNLQETGLNPNVSWVNEDICNIAINSASLVIMNYTLQFIPLPLRHELISKISNGMLAGGALLLSEKICFESTIIDSEMNELYHSFKRANGYSALEISQKRTALEDVLVRESVGVHLQRLQDSFSTVTVLFQSFNFVSFLAIK
ncbi:tRNA (cmo5U34)-methyltransferase [hydrothermal vent metagenome]|uniref:tRNA (Cmo5U34)-methyltransferase n=1 Tax=hydrothermal vent metagenome TaxID=652676 RepID=A0A3B0YCV2_9ZZZZ